MQKILTSSAHGLVKSITTSFLRVTSVRLTTLASLCLATFVLAACGGGSSGSSSGGGGASGIQVTNLKAIPGSGSLTLTWDNPNANISSFDIEVRNLATNDRVAAVSQVNRTISSNPAVNTTAPLAAAGYTITSGLLNDSNYSVAVTVNLQGVDAGRATSARGLSGRRYLPANGVRIGANTDEDQYANAVDNCPAIKNDDQANTYGGADNMGDACGDIDNDRIVDADDNCAVVANTDQLDTIGNGIGDACDSTDDGDGIANDRDNCPFTANPNQEDGDGDNVGDLCDVDADGDGLIELSTAVELNMMRNNLNGTGLDADNRDNNNINGGNALGCPASGCNGYEQIANIDLNDILDDAIPSSNWEPVGTCGSADPCRVVEEGAQFFSGTFSGNDFTISNLFINITTGHWGVGFFGAISSTAQLQNVHIRGGNITRTGVTSQYLGGLVGSVNGATISNSSVTLDEISGTSNVGGLVGSVNGATISSSIATVGSISGTGSVGGLVGAGNNVAISFSLATVGSVSGTDLYLGGLVGLGDGATISSSVATVGSISGGGNVGGLIGFADGVTISSSVATVGSVSGTGLNVGGLLGLVDGTEVIISSSLATVGALSGDSNVGGLVAFGAGATINSSVAVTNNITGTNPSEFVQVGGLVGEGRAPIPSVTASYWDSRVTLITLMPSGNTVGSAMTTAELRNPVVDTNGDGSFPAGIYAEWDNAYCNPNTGEYRATAPNPLGDYVRVWNLGTSSQYPAINCVRNFFSLADQREAARRALAGELPLVD